MCLAVLQKLMIKTFAYLLIGQQVLKHHGEQLKKSYYVLIYY